MYSYSSISDNCKVRKFSKMRDAGVDLRSDDITVATQKYYPEL